MRPGTSALLRRLAAEDTDDVETVLGVVRRLPDPAVAPYDTVRRWLSCDIGAPGASRALVDAFADVDVVVLLAWALQPTHDPERLYRTNVLGTRVVVEAAIRAGVGQIVYASSVGTYAPGSKERKVDESWPPTGVEKSQYSRHKAENEAWLDDIAAWHPEVTFTLLRPGLVFQRDAANEIAHLFLGSVVRTDLLVRLPVPVLPLSRKMIFQAVHADDLADAFLAAVRTGLGGAFNVAADPVLDAADLAAALGGKRVLPVPLGLLRGAAAVSWALHLQPTSPGWIDLAGAAPIMDTAKARVELGWTPKVSATDALAELVAGFADHARHPSPPLEQTGTDRGTDPEG